MAKQLNFFDQAASSTTPTIGNIVASDLITYANDAAYEAAESGAPAEGNIYFNTTSKLIRYYNGTAWISIVDETSTQTIQNKTIDGTDATGNNTVTNDGTDVSFNNTTSGLAATNAQAAIDEVEGRVDTAETNITANDGDITDIRSSVGIADGDTNMGTFSGSTISDNGTAKAGMQELETEVELKEDSANKGAVNGYASLDGSGKVPASELPTSLMEYEGDWNAATNTPTLADTDTGVQGTVYRVTAAGTVNFGAGNITFAIGDWAYNNGTTWELSIETTLPDTDSLPEGSTNLYYTEARVDANTNVTANTAKVSADGSIDTHSDVDTTTVAPVLGQSMTWDGTNWVPGAGGGGGGGSKNYFDALNTNIDSGVFTDFTIFNDGGTYVDGAGGVNTAITAVDAAASSISGAGSARIDFIAVTDKSGHGVSVDTETIDVIDRGKDLIGSIGYTFVTQDSYTSGNIVLRAYDVTNSVILPVFGVDDGIPNAGFANAGANEVQFRIPTSETTAVVRVSLYIPSDVDTTRSYDMVLDEFKYGPEKSLPGVISHGWKSYTPTFVGFGTPTGVTAEYRRSGDSYFVKTRFTVGTTTAVTASMSLPNGVSIDSIKHPTNAVLGSVQKHGVDKVLSLLGDSNNTDLYFGTSTVRLSKATGTNIAVSGNILSFESGPIPITGFSDTNLISTTENMFKNVDVRGQGNGAGSITANVTNIDFTQVADSTNSWNGSQFTAQEAGKYSIQGMINVTAAASFILNSYIDGALDRQIGRENVSATQVNFGGHVYLEKGDVWSLRCNTTRTLSNSASTHWISISSVKDTSVFAVSGESELVEAVDTTIRQTISTSIGVWTSPATAWKLDLTPGEWDLDAMFIGQLGTNAGKIHMEVAFATSSTGGTGLLSTCNLGTATGAGDNQEKQAIVEHKGLVITSNTSIYIQGKMLAWSGGATTTGWNMRNDVSSGIMRARRIK